MAAIVQGLTRLSTNLETTAGRDKLMRATMYVARLIALGYLRRLGGVLPTKGSAGETLLRKCDTVAKVMAEGRRLFRQAKWLPMFPTQTLPAVDAYVKLLRSQRSLLTADALLSRQALVMLNKVLVFAYLFLDQFVWLAKVGVIKINADALSAEALRLWSLSVVFLLVSNMIETSRDIASGKKVSRAMSLTILKDTLELPTCMTYIFPGTPSNPWFVNGTGLAAVAIDIYLNWK